MIRLRGQVRKKNQLRRKLLLLQLEHSYFRVIALIAPSTSFTLIQPSHNITAAISPISILKFSFSIIALIVLSIFFT